MENKAEIFEILLNKVSEITDASIDGTKKLKAICELLRDNVDYYNWVGFYIVDKPKRELILIAFAGESTEHLKIPCGRGICGQAAEKKETLIVQDVSKETNYLSCSPKVKSEIVVPILQNTEIIGELDIDSHTLSPFTKEDKKFLERVCNIVIKLFEKI